MTVARLFLGELRQDRIAVERLLLVYLTANLHGPRPSLQRLGFLGRIILLGTKLVEVVVIGDVLKRSWFFAGAVLTFAGYVKFRSGMNGVRSTSNSTSVFSDNKC